MLACIVKEGNDLQSMFVSEFRGSPKMKEALDPQGEKKMNLTVGQGHGGPKNIGLS